MNDGETEDEVKRRALDIVEDSKLATTWGMKSSETVKLV